MPSSAPSTALRWTEHDGLPETITTADGTRWVSRDPDGGGLWLRIPSGDTIGLRFDVSDHPVLGRCDAVVDAGGAVLAHGSAIDWRNPTKIPALDRPGALPRGAGTAVLNLLAHLAQRAHDQPLRYHGPYPSDALWQSLTASFVVDEPHAQAHARFVADAPARALRGADDPIPVDFRPAPHTWRWSAPTVCTQHRDGLERLYVDGHAYAVGRAQTRRLDHDDERWVARVCVGGQPWHDVCVLDSQLDVLTPPLPLPPPPADLIDQALPPPVVEVLAAVLVQQAPPGLSESVQTLVRSAPMKWGDPGNALVTASTNEIVLHAGLVAQLPTDPTALLGTLVHLLQPPLTRAAARHLAARWNHASGLAVGRPAK